MNKKDRYLISVDLDSTILSALFSLDPKSVWSLMDAQDAGHIVMINTARPTCLAIPYYRALGLNSLLGTVNGNYLYHPDDPSIPWKKHELSAEVSADILAAIRELDIGHPWIQNDDDIYTLDGVYPPYPYFRMMFRHARLHRVDQLPIMPCGRIFAVADTEEKFLLMKERFQDVRGVHVGGGLNKAGTWNVTLFSKEADKWTVAKEAAAFYGIDDDHIACFGDENNDRLMVTSARHGYVMCNGNPDLVADMKALGKGVTAAPCGEGGVGFELMKLLNL